MFDDLESTCVLIFLGSMIIGAFISRRLQIRRGAPKNTELPEPSSDTNGKDALNLKND